MIPHNCYADIKDRKSFSKFLRILFNAKRKTLLNNLKMLGNISDLLEILETENISPSIRAEKLQVSQIASLYKKITLLKK
jgi:16S rRNA (adenine1518-N6/adenine1519-N6)-dimethyltransferase